LVVGRGDRMISRLRMSPRAPLLPGDALALTGDADGGGALWLIHAGRNAARDGFDRAVFDPDEERCGLADARVALSRAVPALWQGVEDVPVDGAIRVGDGKEHPIDRLDGTSFGLAFGLALASASMGVAPARIAATGVVDPSGEVLPCDWIEAKVRAAYDLDFRGVVIPRGRDAAEAARRALPYRVGHFVDDTESTRSNIEYLIHMGEFVVVQVATLGDAIRSVVGDAANHLVTLSDRDVARLPDALTAIALEPRDKVADWSPIETAATLLLDRSCWTSEDRLRLAFAAVVAARHDGRSAEAAVVAAFDANAFLELQPSAPRRAAVAASCIQQAADTHTVPAPEARALIKRFLKPRREAHRDDLRVIGAAARWYGHRGDFRRSIELARDATQGWIDIGESGGASIPLCWWLRVATASGDDDALSEAVSVMERRFRDRSQHPFVAAAWIRSRVERGVAVDESEMNAPSIEAAPAHLSAGVERSRWLQRGGTSVPDVFVRRFTGTRTASESALMHVLVASGLLAAGGTPPATEALASFVEQVRDTGRTAAATNVLRVLTTRRVSRMATPKLVVTALAELRPGIVANLRSARPKPDDATLLKWWPY